jgi:hypothetical protein
MKAKPLFAGASRLALGKERDLPAGEVNALVLKSGDNMVAFCAVDVPAIDHDLVREVCEKLLILDSKIALPQLMVTATGVYTSLGQGVLHGPLNEMQFGAFSSSHRDRLVNRILFALSEAEDSIEPARLRIGESEAPNHYVSAIESDGTVDTTLTALSVEDSSGVVLAYLVNTTAALPEKSEEDRGIAGALAESLRAKQDSPGPVIFVPGPSCGLRRDLKKDTSTAEFDALVGAELAHTVLEALEKAELSSEVALAARAWRVNLPPTLMASTIPQETVLREIRLDQAVFLTMPGLPAAQVGMLLRIKAMQQGFSPVFLPVLTGDYVGLQPTVEGFFANEDPHRMSLYGPLSVTWYATHHLRGSGKKGRPLWTSVPALGRHASAYKLGLLRGEQDAEEIHQHWQRMKTGIPVILPTFVNFTPALQGLTTADAGIGLHYGATTLRKLAFNYSAEESAQLLGIFQGADIPFDAICYLQILSRTDNLSENTARIVTANALRGIDFLAE